MPYHRDARAREPTMIHISCGDGEPLCNTDTYPWPERCMDESFARTLPICPDCEQIVAKRREEMSNLKPVIVAPAPPVVVDNPPKRSGPLFLIDYLGDDE
jgi:hypothetical protein